MNTITLSVQLDDAPELCYRIALDKTESIAFEPLPSGRELGGWEAITALDMMDKRRTFARRLAERLSDAVMEIIEHRDPVDGYKRVYEEADKFRAGLGHK